MSKKFMLLTVFCFLCMFSVKSMADIFSAAASGDIDAMEIALSEEGEDVNATDKNGKTPLLIAIEKSSLNTVNYLFDNDADFEVRDNLGNSALMLACAVEKKDIVELLLQKGIDVDERNKNGETALIIAVKKNNDEIALLLLSKQANIAATDKYGNTALIYAAINNNAELIKELTAAADQSLTDYKNKNGLSAFFIASALGNLEAVKQLIQSGADVTLNSASGINPLMACCSLGNLKTVKYLTDKIGF
ncbi:ankyrin repeat domain-containing protein, partial [Candidatus Ruminimicrobium bovinum]|uniref:ankyrin repeat domain-containing protein n=1 Tax=Candidatus Ruminimicrobium bovinum TaxID=3242779 RepID=UPI0039B86A3F